MHAAQRTVLAHGCFDLIHVGHIRHLEEARRQGDRLVVSVTSDRFVKKGHDRPRFGQEQRMEALRALRCVDDVVLNDAPDAVPIIETLKPAIYVKGVDYENVNNDEALRREAEAAVACGGRLFITRSAKWSSSRLLNEMQFDGETVRFLEYARAKGYRDQIMKAFDDADELVIGFVGETITDEYRYVRAIGKPSKEVAIATVDVGQEIFSGGVVAAAKHAEWQNVRIATGHGLTKTRFVDSDFNRKLFEVYSDRTIKMAEKEARIFTEALAEISDDCDAVVVFDFGHGLISEKHRTLLQCTKFLAVNAQSNAGNYGFNLVTKYAAAKLVCVDDPEARLAAGMQHGEIDAVTETLAWKMDKDAKYIVTHGKNGCVVYDQGAVVRIPAFSSHGIDTMGAGDAFLAVAAPLTAAGLSTEAAAFAGNVAGAIKIGIVGHRRHVERERLVQTIDTLLK